jgi:hypothetical protein
VNLSLSASAAILIHLLPSANVRVSVKVSGLISPTVPAVLSTSITSDKVFTCFVKFSGIVTVWVLASKI